MVIRPDVRLARRARVVYGCFAILVLGVAVVLVAASIVDENAQQAAFFMASGVFLLGYSWWAWDYCRAIPEFMIIEGEWLHVVWPGGRTKRLRLEGAVHDGQGLLVGACWVPLYVKFKGYPRQPLYRSEEIEALKARASEVSAMRLFLQGLPRGASVCWSRVLIGAGVLAAIAVILPVIPWIERAGWFPKATLR